MPPHKGKEEEKAQKPEQESTFKKRVRKLKKVYYSSHTPFSTRNAVGWRLCREQSKTPFLASSVWCFQTKNKLNIFLPEKRISPCCSNRMKQIRIKLSSQIWELNHQLKPEWTQRSLCTYISSLGWDRGGWSKRVKVQMVAGTGAVRPSIWTCRSCYVMFAHFLLLHNQWPKL